VWRTVMVQKPARLSLRNRQLHCENEDGINQLAIEDIAWLILETPQTSVTGALLSHLADSGVGVMTCDEKHLPNGVLMPFVQHHRQLSQLSLQLSWTEPFKKRCWQHLVIAKIKNQAAHLASLGDEEASALLRHDASRVLSGDSDNREAVAAKRYWLALFGDDFRRKESTGTTAALNYGYALIRAAIGRSLVATGFMPALGIHHRSQLNGWNLADDLMEPFRPLIDDWVVTRAAETPWNEDLSVTDRQQLVAVLNRPVLMESQTLTLLTACGQVVDTLAKATREASPLALNLPDFGG
jgi:CRISP-associated protein Cas1